MSTNINVALPMIFKKMSEVMKEVGAVGKDQKNTAQGFKFRGIDQFVNALYPALTKHNVFMAPRCVKEEHELKDVERSNGRKGIDKHVTIQMEYDFFAEDGSKVTVGPIPAEGLDSGDKATNKALSAALKYALIQTFSIPTEDMAEADLESPSIGVAPAKTSGNTPTTGGPLLKEQVSAAAGQDLSKIETGIAKVNGTPPAQQQAPNRRSFKPANNASKVENL